VKRSWGDYTLNSSRASSFFITRWLAALGEAGFKTSVAGNITLGRLADPAGLPVRFTAAPAFRAEFEIHAAFRGASAMATFPPGSAVSTAGSTRLPRAIRGVHRGNSGAFVLEGSGYHRHHLGAG